MIFTSQDGSSKQQHFNLEKYPEKDKTKQNTQTSNKTKPYIYQDRKFIPKIILCTVLKTTKHAQAKHAVQKC